MVSATPTELDSVNATPVKSFFVSMLTRDIRLEDAILDLLDNCVDGILRSANTIGVKPYEGYWAEIDFRSDSFSINDNCGGIPWSLHEYAFRMGRPPDLEPDAAGSVGVYGIGMKRAIFKIGRKCLISSRSADRQYEVDITDGWIVDEENWSIPVRDLPASDDEEGTTIVIGDLYDGISKTFGEDAESFKKDLKRMVSHHYAYIMEKGFNVTINGDPVRPRTTKFVCDFQGPPNDSIRPFVFKATSSDVDIYLIVGFTRPIPPTTEVVNDMESTKYSSVDAGWTILCNDRAVLYSDRTELTGWGELGVPRFHNQFIAVSGIVEFRCDDSRKLPTTTTKRGIDASSLLYLQVKNKMREGMRIFTNYTNRWKEEADVSREHIDRGVLLSLDEIKDLEGKIEFAQTRRAPAGLQYRPQLPTPADRQPNTRRISFTKQSDRVSTVAEYLGNPTMSPSEAGEICFDTIYDEASQ